MVLVVRMVLSQQAERTYKNLFESIARVIAMIIDREASMSGSQETEYELPKGVHVDIKIDYKSVFVTYGDETVMKSFSGMLNSGPYEFEDPNVLCFIKIEHVIQIFDKACDEANPDSVIPIPVSTTTTVPSTSTTTTSTTLPSASWTVCTDWPDGTCTDYCKDHGKICVNTCTWSGLGTGGMVRFWSGGCTDAWVVESCDGWETWNRYRCCCI